MFEGTYNNKRMVELFNTGFLTVGVPRLEEQQGPSKWGIEPGLPDAYYLYEKVTLVEPSVAGTRYWTKSWKLKRLFEGQRLKLVREPGNKYDPNAVEVYAPGVGKIGYVPRFAATFVAAKLDSGNRIFARVRHPDTASCSVSMRIYYFVPSVLNA